jgi:hypothetical protein
VTSVEIQSGADAAPSEALSGIFQLHDRGETRGWCVACADSEAEPSSEGRRR